jgi:hypothetical protein
VPSSECPLALVPCLWVGTGRTASETPDIDAAVHRPPASLPQTLRQRCPTAARSHIATSLVSIEGVLYSFQAGRSCIYYYETPSGGSRLSQPSLAHLRPTPRAPATTVDTGTTLTATQESHVLVHLLGTDCNRARAGRSRRPRTPKAKGSSVRIAPLARSIAPCNPGCSCWRRRLPPSCFRRRRLPRRGVPANRRRGGLDHSDDLPCLLRTLSFTRRIAPAWERADAAREHLA